MFKCENASGAIKNFTDTSASSQRALKHRDERTQHSKTNHESLAQPISVKSLNWWLNHVEAKIYKTMRDIVVFRTVLKIRNGFCREIRLKKLMWYRRTEGLEEIMEVREWIRISFIGWWNFVLSGGGVGWGGGESTWSNFKSYQGLKIFKTSQSWAWGCGCGATSTPSEGVEFAPQRNMLFALLADLNHQHKPYRFFWCDSNKLPSLSNNLFLFKDQPQKQSLFSSTTKASSLSYAMVCNFHSFQAANARATITHRARIGGE